MNAARGPRSPAVEGRRHALARAALLTDRGRPDPETRPPNTLHTRRPTSWWADVRQPLSKLPESTAQVGSNPAPNRFQGPPVGSDPPRGTFSWSSIGSDPTTRALWRSGVPSRLPRCAREGLRGRALLGNANRPQMRPGGPAYRQTARSLALRKAPARQSQMLFAGGIASQG